MEKQVYQSENSGGYMFDYFLARSEDILESKHHCEVANHNVMAQTLCLSFGQGQAFKFPVSTLNAKLS